MFGISYRCYDVYVLYACRLLPPQAQLTLGQGNCFNNACELPLLQRTVNWVRSRTQLGKRSGERGWAEEYFQADLTRYLDLSSKSREIIENLSTEIWHLLGVFVWSSRIKLHIFVLLVLFELEDFGIFFLLFRPINFHFERFFFSLRTFEESQFSGLAYFQTGFRLFPIQVSFKENLTVRRAHV